MENKIQMPAQVQEAIARIDQFIAEAGPTPNITVYRQIYDKMDAMGGVPEVMSRVEDRLVPGHGEAIPVRIYRPSLEDNLPILLYFHGGWFSIGGLDSHDTMVRTLARAANCIVVATAYRLAPEHPFPAGLDDCYTVTEWVAGHAEEFGGDAERLAVAGDSAGGALATVVARKAMENKGPRILFQGLFCPVTDASLNTASWKEFATGPVLTLAGALQSWAEYTAGNSVAMNADISPLLAQNLTGMPPALIITSEFDPLRDEAISYADALKRAGVNVKHSDYKGMIHGFYQMAGIIDDSKDAIHEMAMCLIKYFR
jgi:acetyl esterase